MYPRVGERTKRFQDLGLLDQELAVVDGIDSTVHSHRGTGQGRGPVTGVLKHVPGELQHFALLRIHGASLGR